MNNEKIDIKLSLALGNLDSLPAMPDIAHKLLALPLDTEPGEAEMIRLIERDPQLSAKIVGLANSPMLGIGHKLNGIHDASILLGMKKLKSVSIGIAVMSEMKTQPATKNFDPHDLWIHSMTVAIVMNTLSRSMPQRMQPDENLIFLSGLLHDIGLMALHHLNSSASDELHHQLRLQPKQPMHEIELAVLGITHDQIGAMLVRHWNLPEEIVGVIEQHHSLSSSELKQTNSLVRLANITEKLLPDFGVAERTNKYIEDCEWRELGIDPACANELSALANELAMQVVQLPETQLAVQHHGSQVKASTKQTIQPAENNSSSAFDAPIRWFHQRVNTFFS